MSHSRKHHSSSSSASSRHTVISCIIQSFDSAPPTFNSAHYEYISSLSGRAPEQPESHTLGTYAGLPGVSRVRASKFSASTSEHASSEGHGSAAAAPDILEDPIDRLLKSLRNETAPPSGLPSRLPSRLQPPPPPPATKLDTPTSSNAPKRSGRSYQRRAYSGPQPGSSKRAQASPATSTSWRNSYSTVSTDLLLFSSSSSSEVMSPARHKRGSRTVNTQVLRHLSKTERTIVEALLQKAVAKSKHPQIDVAIDEEQALAFPQDTPSSKEWITTSTSDSGPHQAEAGKLAQKTNTQPGQPSIAAKAEGKARPKGSNLEVPQGWESQLQQLDAYAQGVLDSLPRALSSKSGSRSSGYLSEQYYRQTMAQAQTQRRSQLLDGGFQPWQRDMIEEEVVSRLRAPRLNCKVRDALSGRVISFSEVGDPEGNAILMCTGLGLTRYVSELFHELAIALHIRIITIERPGIGASEAHSPYDATGPLAWPNDVRTVCHHIGVRKFSILAHSAGAAYGMAVALTLPQMVRGKVHLMAPWIPPSQLEGLNAEAVGSRVGRSQRILRRLPTPVIRMANLPMVNAAAASMKPLKPSKTSRRQKRAYDDVSNSPQSQNSRTRHPGIRHSMILMDHYLPNNCTLESLLSGGDSTMQSTSGSAQDSEAAERSKPLGPYDLTTGHPLIAGNSPDPLARAAWSRRMAQRTWELAITDGNPAVDLLVCIERDRKIGFSFFDVPLDIVITHGSEDSRIPLEHVRWLAENLNRRVPPAEVGEEEDLFTPVDGPPNRAFWEDGRTSPKNRCELRVLDGQGHSLMADSAIVSSVLAEIAAAWDR